MIEFQRGAFRVFTGCTEFRRGAKEFLAARDSFVSRNVPSGRFDSRAPSFPPTPSFIRGAPRGIYSDYFIAALLSSARSKGATLVARLDVLENRRGCVRPPLASCSASFRPGSYSGRAPRYPRDIYVIIADALLLLLSVESCLCLSVCFPSISGLGGR